MMRCELRDHEADTLAILPIPKPDGSLITMACLEHARESDYFCLTHDVPHTGFGAGGHTCLRCIDENVRELAYKATFYSRQLERGLTFQEFQRLSEWAELTSQITGDPPAVCILRATLTTAARLRRRKYRPSLDDAQNRAEEVVQEALATKSAEKILPREVSERWRIGQ